LGRVRLTRQLENSSQCAATADDTTGIKVQTRYGYSGNLTYQSVSNPYRSTTSAIAATAEAATMGWTVSASDWHGLGSVTTGAASSAAPSSIPCPNTGTATGSQVTCSSGNTAAVADEAGVERTNSFDGLGRLKQVVENGIGSAVTSYTYDVQGNLTGVTQNGGTQTRSFGFDSLGRLSTAGNPESGTTSYKYL
jgi:YD repeat-containing protein